jgi:hypothetical protein
MDFLLVRSCWANKNTLHVSYEAPGTGQAVNVPQSASQMHILLRMVTRQGFEPFPSDRGIVFFDSPRQFEHETGRRFNKLDTGKLRINI